MYAVAAWFTRFMQIYADTCPYIAMQKFAGNMRSRTCVVQETWQNILFTDHCRWFTGPFCSEDFWSLQGQTYFNHRFKSPFKLTIVLN